MKRRITRLSAIALLALLLTAHAGMAEETDNDWRNVGSIALGDTIVCDGDGLSIIGGTVIITKGGDFTVTGTLKAGQILVETDDKVKLRLSGCDITCPDGPAIFFQQSKKSFITLTEGTVNRLTDGESYAADAKAALFSNDTLEIKGGGELIVTGNYKHGIASDDDIIIENGQITVTAKTDGLHANDDITVAGGSLSITASSDGMESEATLTVDGGAITVRGAEEGIEAKTVLTINGGEIDIQCRDDGINAGQDAVLNGGTLHIECDGDGLDSNGGMTINGGEITVFSGDNANGPVDTDEMSGAFVVNGGFVIATGGNMGARVSEQSAQHAIWIGEPIAANATVAVTDENGNDVIRFAAVKSASLTLFSAPALVSGGTYTVTVNGASLGAVTLTEASASVGRVSGGFGGRGGGK